MVSGGLVEIRNDTTRGWIGLGSNANFSTTSGNYSHVYGNPTSNPASGSQNFASFHLTPIANGTSSGTFYGQLLAVRNTAWTGGTIKLASLGITTTDGFTGYTALIDGDTTGLWRATLYGTFTNCASSASPAVCSAAPAGAAVIAAAATSVVVNTTAVTANSQILVVQDQSLGTRLSVTCNTQSDLVVGTPEVSARSAGTSFTVIVPVAPTTDPLCFNYLIVN